MFILIMSKSSTTSWPWFGTCIELFQNVSRPCMHPDWSATQNKMGTSSVNN